VLIAQHNCHQQIRLHQWQHKEYRKIRGWEYKSIMLAREGRLGYTARHDGVVLMKCVPSTIVANSKH